MIFFVFELIVISIFVFAFAYGVRLVPRYAERKHSVLVQAIYSGILTAILTALVSFGFYPSWLALLLMIFFTLMVSVWITNGVMRKNGEEIREKR